MMTIKQTLIIMLVLVILLSGFYIKINDFEFEFIGLFEIIIRMF